MSRVQRPSPGQIRRRRRGGALVLTALLLGGAYLILSVTVLAPADRHGADVLGVTIHSRAVGADLHVSVVIPGGGTRSRPMLVFLHGRGESTTDYTEDEAMYEALARLRRRAPVLVFPEGGDHSYWHDRSSGGWGDYVVDEVIPAAAQLSGADPQHVAIGGISMGGFGAYDLAMLHPGRFCAVGGHSPALWLDGAETAQGAFDDAEDFERNDVIAAIRADPGAFGGIPVWNDAGSEDPFKAADAAFDEALEAGGARLSKHSWPGGHERSYWDAHWDAYLRFYAAALAGCG